MMSRSVTRLSLILCLSCIACFSTFSIFGPGSAFAGGIQQSQELPSLSLNAPLERELAGGQTHVYRIALDAGQFALVQVEQRGAELLLMANRPDGKEFAGVDLRIGGIGVEPLAIVADAAGEYLLKVVSRNQKG